MIADWLFANKIEGLFELPKLSLKELQLQGLQQNYTY